MVSRSCPQSWGDEHLVLFQGPGKASFGFREAPRPQSAPWAALILCLRWPDSESGSASLQREPFGTPQQTTLQPGGRVRRAEGRDNTIH